MADARIHLKCDGCGRTVSFSVEDAGTVQECPECGAYLDIPEATWRASGHDQQSLRYEQQAREVDRQQAVGAVQLEQYQRQLDRLDRIAACQEANGERLAQLIDRWHALAARLERFLSDLEQRGGA